VVTVLAEASIAVTEAAELAEETDEMLMWVFGSP
jgi:hypothetical protein